jgi:hypothetical protein
MNLANTIFVTTQTITMEEIWKKLPNDLVVYILYFTDIDTRRAVGLKPQRNRLPIFDFKIKPLIWTPLYNGFALYCGIKKNNKNLTGKLVYKVYDDHVEYLTFISSTSWHIMDSPN